MRIPGFLMTTPMVVYRYLGDTGLGERWDDLGQKGRCARRSDRRLSRRNDGVTRIDHRETIVTHTRLGVRDRVTLPGDEHRQVVAVDVREIGYRSLPVYDAILGDQS